MNIDNNEIIRALAQDKDRGFRMLMEKFGEPLYWHIRRIVVSHDDAQDAEQETFIKAFRSIDKLQDKNALTPWLYRIATRQALTSIERNRSSKRHLCANSEGRESAEPTADCYVDYSDLESVKLQNAILSLPPKQQLAFNLRYYDEMSFEEISQVAGTTPSSVKVSYHVAKDKIIAYMNSND